MTKLAAWYPGGHHLWGFQTLKDPKIWYLVFLKKLILRMKKKKFRKRPKIFLFGPSARCQKIFLGPWQIYLLDTKKKKIYDIARFRLKIQFLSKMLIFVKSSPFEPVFDPAKIGVYQKFSFSMFSDPTELELTPKIKILFSFSKSWLLWYWYLRN